MTSTGERSSEKALGDLDGLVGVVRPVDDLSLACPPVIDASHLPVGIVE